MDRREFFTKTRKKISSPAKKLDKITTHRLIHGLTPYSGSWTVNEVAHLLKRTMFGAKKADIDYFLGLSPGQAVDELLGNSSTPAPPVRDYGLIEDTEGIFYDDLGVVQGQPWVNDPNMLSAEQIRGNINSLRIDSLKKMVGRSDH